MKKVKFEFFRYYKLKTKDLKLLVLRTVLLLTLKKDRIQRVKLFINKYYIANSKFCLESKLQKKVT